MIDKYQRYLDNLAIPFITIGSYVDDYWPDGSKVVYKGHSAIRYSAYVVDQNTAKELAEQMRQSLVCDEVPFNYRVGTHHQTSGRFAGKYKIEIYIW